jgi:endonuclease YncB( thermonuclease family)
MFSDIPELKLEKLPVVLLIVLSFPFIFSKRKYGAVVRTLITAIFFVSAFPSWAAEVIIADGDTLVLNGAPHRLDGIHAPKTDQVCLNETGAVWSCGIEARDKLKEFVGNRDVRCDGKKYDTVYRNRRISVCRIEGEALSLNQWLVREGWALNFEPYAKGRFKADQDEAREKGRGLWKGCFSPPQSAQRGNKSTASLLGAACTKGQVGEIRDILFPDNPAMPPGCSIKGKLAARAHFTGHRGIYHMESCRSYGRTKRPDRWFCSEGEAQAEGFRKAFTC